PAAGGGGEAFVAKFDPGGAALLFSTYLGGSEFETGWGIAVDPRGNTFVTGITGSSDFPTKGALQPVFHPGAEESFVVKYPVEADTTLPKLAFASTRGEAQTVYVTFTEPIDEASATDPSHYAIDPGVTVTAAGMAGNSKTVRLTTSLLDPAIAYTLTVNNVIDRAPTPNRITADSQIKLSNFPLVEGKITRKIFKDIPGTLVKHLTSHPKFPNSPDVVEYVDHFETAVDALDNYGVQLKGFIQSPLTSDYVFYLCSDGEGELFLSTDETGGAKALIAFEPVGNGSREWITGRNQSTRGEPPSNVSARIHLEGGRLDYVEALMKAATGGDNLAIAWRLASQSPPINGDPPISPLYLWSPVTIGAPTMALEPQNQTVTELQPVSFSVAVDGAPPFSFQWIKDGVAIPGATGDTYRISSASLTEDGAKFSVVVSNASGSVTSAAAVLRVTPDITPPTVVRVRPVTLEQIEIIFAEPVTAGSATDVSHYSLESTTGSATIQSAAVSGEPARAVLTTSRLKEGTEYLLKVGGI
ncbi:MAG: SBBP repeat-containing protein, partial [Pedosphaera parvula]|nr:SBBP repeat-containing protein [Pedosphaera parvula]